MNKDKLLDWRVAFHKALGNPIRLEIVEKLVEEELCQCEIFPSIGLAQSTVSSYLSQLVRAGILSVRRDGQRKMYSISNDRIRSLIKETKRVLTEIHE